MVKCCSIASFCAPGSEVLSAVSACSSIFAFRVGGRSGVRGCRISRSDLTLAARPVWTHSLALRICVGVCFPIRSSAPPCRRCGSYSSVDDLEAAVYDYLAQHNERPKPFKQTKTAEDNLTRERRALDKLDEIRRNRYEPPGSEDQFLAKLSKEHDNMCHHRGHKRTCWFEYFEQLPFQLRHLQVQR